MTTEKLYYIDSHMFAFEAKVLDCRREKSGWAVTLDRTAFFPCLLYTSPSPRD